MNSNENLSAQSPKKGDLKRPKKETGTKRQTDRKGRKGRPSILVAGLLPCSPSILLASLSAFGVRRTPLIDKRFLGSVRLLVDLSRDDARKRKRAKQVPWLRDNPKSFEITNTEARLGINRLPLVEGHPSGRKSIELMAFLEEQKIVRVLMLHSNRPPARGTIYAFTCERFMHHKFEIEPGFCRKVRSKKDELIAGRKSNPHVEIYRAHLAKYFLPNEYIELIPYYIGFDAEGDPKFYEDQYAALKKWDRNCNAKRGSYHSVYSNIPDVFRVRRRDAEGVHLALVDISSAFAVFLHKLLRMEVERDQRIGRSSKSEAYAYYYPQLSSLASRDHPSERSERRFQPRQIVIIPGSPSPLRPRKPPSLAMRTIASLIVGGVSGKGFLL